MKALFLLLLAPGLALADDAALRHCRTLTDTANRLACYDAIPLAPVRTPEQDFGIETVKKTVEAPKSIATTIPGRFDGWQPGQAIKLANGQTWRIVDGSQAVLAPLQDPKVTVERNAFGTMFLKIEGTNQSPKVRRVN
ncbi:hypothetical protein IP92_00660 [Pseudoduganella flava]|uniref:Uncharacterized protein n=1 Tax=Pseudoduganella flava TaxID=871742 RepID=A0A562Q4L7_9BURK|nr:hypothetical protein [Pseudoduganella flava]QGZ41678.1 hypothetical protein GO485_23225 [Pseudoduganella flava]TWI51672.1 hypothetical protein IP92_00660 [Pseudoduganella flava]